MIQKLNWFRNSRCTTRDLTLGDVQKWLFSLCFAFCDVQVIKKQSSPNVDHKMYSVTKMYFFVTNFVTILSVSLICDARILSLPSPKNVTKYMP